MPALPFFPYNSLFLSTSLISLSSYISDFAILEILLEPGDSVLGKDEKIAFLILMFNIIPELGVDRETSTEIILNIVDILILPGGMFCVTTMLNTSNSYLSLWYFNPTLNTCTSLQLFCLFLSSTNTITTPVFTSIST